MMRALASAIAHSTLSAELQERTWIVPAVQSVHIVAIAFLFFSAVAVSAETARRRPAPAGAPWIAGAFGWTWAALAVLLLSGSVLIGAEPARSLMNVFFRTKMVLVIAAAAATVLLQHRLAGSGFASLAARRATALLPIGLWLLIIFCGRFIAYFGNLAA